MVPGSLVLLACLGKGWYGTFFFSQGVGETQLIFHLLTLIQVNTSHGDFFVKKQCLELRVLYTHEFFKVGPLVHESYPFIFSANICLDALWPFPLFCVFPMTSRVSVNTRTRISSI